MDEILLVFLLFISKVATKIVVYHKIKRSSIFFDCSSLLFPHENDILSQPADALPGNDGLGLPAQKAQPFQPSGNDQSRHPSAVRVDLGVPDVAQPLARFQMDDLPCSSNR